MSDQQQYSYAASVKSPASDELINTWLIRPAAGVFVRLVFPTSLSPNHLTILSIIAGIVSALLYLKGTAAYTLAAGLFISLKDILDSADGQLARARQQYSRAGRFLDSIGDFLVNLAVFAAIAFALYVATGSASILLTGFLAFAGTTLRVSYHVFYHTSYLHLLNRYDVNRVTEEIREEDETEPAGTLRLHRIFQSLYGWQDRLMVVIDTWCRGKRSGERSEDLLWYGDPTALRLSGLLGLGTELFLLMLFSVTNRLDEYLVWNVVVMNLLFLGSIIYRRAVLSGALRARHPRGRG